MRRVRVFVFLEESIILIHQKCECLDVTVLEPMDISSINIETLGLGEIRVYQFWCYRDPKSSPELILALDGFLYVKERIEQHPRPWTIVADAVSYPFVRKVRTHARSARRGNPLQQKTTAFIF